MKVNMIDQSLDSNSYEFLSFFLKYNPETGELRIRKRNSVVFSVDGWFMFNDHINKKKYKKNTLNVCWTLNYKEVCSKDEKVYPRNMNPQDTRLCNLAKIDKASYAELRDAFNVLNGGIKVVPHKEDAFSCTVKWFANDKLNMKVCPDAVSVDKFKRELSHKYMKILTKYCIFDQ